MKKLRALSTAILLSAITSAACGDEPKVEISLRPLVTRHFGLDRSPPKPGDPTYPTVNISIEFANRSDKPLTFIVPLDGSEAGWLEPKYLFAIKVGEKERHGGGRCGNFGTRYEPSVFFTVPPRESRYVITQGVGTSLPADQGKITASLKYSVAEKPTDAEKMRYFGDVKSLEKWPANTFVGSVESKAIEFDPADAEKVEPVPMKDMPRPAPGKAEAGLEVQLFPAANVQAIKLQAWEEPQLWMGVTNVGEVPIVFKNKTRLEYHWIDEAGKEVEHFEYAGSQIAVKIPQHEQPEIKTGIWSEAAAGFVKKAGKYKVSLTIHVEGRGKATSNVVDVEVVENKIAK